MSITHKGIPMTQAQLDAIVPVLNLRPMPQGKRLERLAEESMAKAGQPFNERPTNPCRVQRRRAAGFKLPPFTRCVDRSNKVYGNPFVVGIHCETSAGAVSKYAEWLVKSPYGRETAERAKRELRGWNLACFCKPGTPCHADVLLSVANVANLPP